MTEPARNLPWGLQLCWCLGRVLGQVGPVVLFMLCTVALVVAVAEASSSVDAGPMSGAFVAMVVAAFFQYQKSRAGK